MLPSSLNVAQQIRVMQLHCISFYFLAHNVCCVALAASM